MMMNINPIKKKMIQRLFYSLLCLVIVTGAIAQAKARKAVFVIVDGVPFDVIKKLSLPAFTEISKVGGLAQTLVGGERNGYSQTPTISAVGYNSVMTGTWVNKHNVWDNDIAAPNYNYPTIFRILKSAQPEKKIAVFSSWLDNRTKLIGDGLKETGEIKMDYYADGYELDTVQFPHDNKRDFMHRIDEKVVAEAAQSIRDRAPDLSWVYLEYTDDMGHMYGDSPQFYKAVEYADRQVQKLWEAIQYREKNLNEEWLIIVTTDHGRNKETGKDHGGQSDREKAGWILTNAAGLNARFKSGNSAMVDIMPTIARFLNINPDEAVARETDGLPIIGKLSFSGLKAKRQNSTIELRWKPEEGSGEAKIFVATTNHFKTGGKDDYQFLKTVKIKEGKAVLNMPSQSDFYKIVMEGPHSRMNVWITDK
jgi:predicted AlkP superfamily pyrophosphatase or phosphodiesterase